MKSAVNAAAIAAFASLALAKEMPVDEELSRTVYQSGLRHMEIMNHKEVKTYRTSPDERHNVDAFV